MSKAVRLEKAQFMIDDKPFFVYSGEMHYYRIKPSLWGKHLQRAKEAGLNTVSTYIPWSWHESKEGEFDFTGKTHPQKNLLGFLKKVKESGLKLIARVGPVSNAEMINEGIPAWLLKNYPEVFVLGKEFVHLNHCTLLCYNNPTFLKFVRRWHEQLLPIIKDNTYPSGSVTVVQLCNEIGMIHWLNKAADYSENTEKMYREFLKDKYAGKIAPLNALYETKYGDFSEVKQPESGDDKYNMNMLWDWMAFYQHYYAVYYKALHKNFTDNGLDLPVIANIPQYYDFDVRGRGIFGPMTTMMFRDFPKFVPEVMFGGAYQMRRLDYENFHDVALTSEVVRLITKEGVPVTCAELQTGIMRDRPRLYGADVELNLKTSMSQGLNALNCYMFSGGKNELEYGGFGSYHEWQSPVTSDGEKRPHFDAMADFGKLVKTYNAQISGSEKQSDTAIGFYCPYYTTEYLKGDNIGRWEDYKLQLFYDGFARLLQLSNINFKFVDLEKASVEELLKEPSICVFTLEFMDEATQKKLAQYVERGGNLMVNPYLPEKNQALAKCTALADSLGLKTASSYTRGQSRFFIKGVDYLSSIKIDTYDVPKDAKIIATDSDNKPSGVLISKGKGKALVLGFGLNHVFDYHISLMRDFAKLIGIKAAVEINPDLISVLRAGKDYGFLFLFNYHDQQKTTKIKMVLPGEKKPVVFPSKGEIKFSGRRCYVLPLNVKLASGDVIRYSSAEVLSIAEKGAEKTLTITAQQGSAVELQLVTASKKASLDGKKVQAVYKGGMLTVSFTADGNYQKLVIKK